MPALTAKPPTLLALLPKLSAVEDALRSLRLPGGGATPAAVERYLAESAAARFHLSPRAGPAIVAIVGGTGTGKSTLLNRLLGANLSAASFRRTFTAGAVAVTHPNHPLPRGWLGIETQTLTAEQLPARGSADRLAVTTTDHPLLQQVSLIDTPDLDGDQPLHHAQADRAFRWAHAAVFLVTPEKYQMPEVVPYYRLARRYALPAIFVMNKAEARDVLDDFTAQLARTHGIDNPRVFCIARDDSTFEPPREQNLEALVREIEAISQPGGFSPGIDSIDGAATRVSDLMQRGADQVIEPLLDARSAADRVVESLRSLTTPTTEIDVHPLTQQLQRRLQQRSVLYLMGPQRIFDRVRQVPLMLARLPRKTWDLFRTGQLKADAKGEDVPDDWQKTGPDFRTALVDQMSLLQAKLDDVIRSSPVSAEWITRDPAAHAAARMDPAAAGAIAGEELAELRKWLEQRWNAVPRDTRVVQSLLKVIPGGRKLTEMSEAAPYLLAIVVASHHAVFGGVDLLILGGYSLATWLTEKLSNEVAGRTKQANARIAERFTDLAAQQVERMIQWVQKQAPPKHDIDRAAGMMQEIHDLVRKGT